MYNTTFDVDLLKEINIPAAQLDIRQNDLLEELKEYQILKLRKRRLFSNNRLFLN